MRKRIFLLSFLFILLAVNINLKAQKDDITNDIAKAPPAIEVYMGKLKSMKQEDFRYEVVNGKEPGTQKYVIRFNTPTGTIIKSSELLNPEEQLVNLRFIKEEQAALKQKIKEDSKKGITTTNEIGERVDKFHTSFLEGKFFFRWYDANGAMVDLPIDNKQGFCISLSEYIIFYNDKIEIDFEKIFSYCKVRLERNAEARERKIVQGDVFRTTDIASSISFGRIGNVEKR